MSRSDKLDAISRNFSKLKGKPHDFENTIEEAVAAPLPILAAETIAQEAHKKGAISAKKCDLSEASMYGGEDSFGRAPSVETTTEDIKQRLLNTERFLDVYFVIILNYLYIFKYFNDLRYTLWLISMIELI